MQLERNRNADLLSTSQYSGKLSVSKLACRLQRPSSGSDLLVMKYLI